MECDILNPPQSGDRFRRANLDYDVLSYDNTTGLLTCQCVFGSCIFTLFPNSLYENLRINDIEMLSMSPRYMEPMEPIRPPELIRSSAFIPENSPLNSEISYPLHITYLNQTSIYHNTVGVPMTTYLYNSHTANVNIVTDDESEIDDLPELETLSEGTVTIESASDDEMPDLTEPGGVFIFRTGVQFHFLNGATIYTVTETDGCPVHTVDCVDIYGTTSQFRVLPHGKERAIPIDVETVYYSL